jgi:hypothetical protein
MPKPYKQYKAAYRIYTAIEALTDNATSKNIHNYIENCFKCPYTLNSIRSIMSRYNEWLWTFKPMWEIGRLEARYKVKPLPPFLVDVFKQLKNDEMPRKDNTTQLKLWQAIKVIGKATAPEIHKYIFEHYQQSFTYNSVCQYLSRFNNVLWKRVKMRQYRALPLSSNHIAELQVINEESKKWLETIADVKQIEQQKKQKEKDELAKRREEERRIMIYNIMNKAKVA